MDRNKALKRILDGMNVCIDVSDSLPRCDEYGDPSNCLTYSRELPLAREYLKKIAGDSQAISEEKILYIANLIKSCARDMKKRGLELLAEETSDIADELVQTFAAEVVENVSA